MMSRWTCAPAKSTRLIGPNGAGKSTLIAQIAGGLTPDAGAIRISWAMTSPTLDTVGRAKLGLGRTFQVSALAMEYTALQNAVLGAMGASGGVFRFFRRALSDQDAARRR